MNKEENKVQDKVTPAAGRPEGQASGGPTHGNIDEHGNNGGQPGGGDAKVGKEGQGVGGGQENRITVQIRYQSEVVPVTINRNAAVRALLVDAIRATGNDVGQQDRFQLKLGGTVLDPQGKVSDYPIEEGTLLVLVLVAGGGGNNHKGLANCWS